VIVSLIVAMDRNCGIGLNNKLPWRLPADMKRFKELTMGHHLIVGRKTWESIGRILPGRKMIVLTRDQQVAIEGVEVVHSIQEALRIAEDAGETEAFVGGGAEVYREALAVANRIYLTLVEGEFDVDTCFPAINWKEWIEESSESFPVDDRNPQAFTFKVVMRRNPVSCGG